MNAVEYGSIALVLLDLSVRIFLYFSRSGKTDGDVNT